jgi:hypothetical protein
MKMGDGEWHYGPRRYGGTEINESLAVLAAHPGVVRSVLLTCGHGVSSMSAGVTSASHGVQRHFLAGCSRFHSIKGNQRYKV